MNPDTSSLNNNEDAGLAARNAIVTKAENDTLRNATTEILGEKLSMARANAVHLRLWTDILKHHEVDNSVNDPTTLIANINQLGTPPVLVLTLFLPHWPAS
ncbi:hypothetical protein H257_16805 [Aphanomyces astaci]|uniref:Uncharacterized protein n=1 Tax=Aphanomyces astaci TaxID=112090 RepID=W4FHD8_APHAT|nr:hypothetical protein H257_16805 [Aphanomyces astaci]ETV66875.1 hypothetical protein H257_16805 [Aphanomyces astaci]|eukprot:XP_009843678.1 hypothetical protein H257_16805 [Aphanomyces astaci]